MILYISQYFDETLTGATTPGQSGPGINNNEWFSYLLFSYIS